MARPVANSPTASFSRTRCSVCCGEERPRPVTGLPRALVAGLTLTVASSRWDTKAVVESASPSARGLIRRAVGTVTGARQVAVSCGYKGPSRAEGVAVFVGGAPPLNPVRGEISGNEDAHYELFQTAQSISRSGTAVLVRSSDMSGRVLSTVHRPDGGTSYATSRRSKKAVGD